MCQIALVARLVNVTSVGPTDQPDVTLKLDIAHVKNTLNPARAVNVRQDSGTWILTTPKDVNLVYVMDSVQKMAACHVINRMDSANVNFTLIIMITKPEGSV